KQSQPDYGKYELNPYLEYGLSDSLTLGANLLFDRAHQDGAAGGPSHTNWNLGDSEFFLRTRLWQQNGFVVSAEPMIKLPSPEPSDAQPPLGGSSPDAGLGLSAGYGFSAWGLSHFANLDTQYRHRFGAPHDQARLNGTLGIGVAPRWMVMPQAFMTWRTVASHVADFTNSPANDYDLVRLQLSAVYRWQNDLSFQFGGFDDVAGKNTGTGSGVLFALWRSF
ncbi:MAG: hypothetical protein KGJ21_10475, partial [Pseudomonadota bacterium]|nr:hypothetical protein [Pseudomonadota bacterium]